MPRQLKIDRRFIQLLPDAGTTIATAIISLAHGFNLCVVAEGVENRAQLGWLQRAGCDLVQGYLLARPMRAQDISAMPTRKRTQEDVVTSQALSDPDEPPSGQGVAASPRAAQRASTSAGSTMANLNRRSASTPPAATRRTRGPRQRYRVPRSRSPS
ncbi:MAG TPA: EAL domain-containing protein [Paraburkholderia sp.]|nr:EAL domain-containing protein [Paraburkholderia sp.]